jgi:outer membrane receptor protein involved in Fe transport
MSKRLSSAAFLLLTTTLISPAALAQTSGSNTPPAGAPGNAPTTATGNPTQDEAETQAAPEVSIPGGGDDIVVVGRKRVNVQESAPQVISVLSTEDIARTGEGDIAGALQRVTGLSVVGSGFVYVRGLGDRYSLALLNGSPLPSPEPLKRVVPLDIFPTDVIASSLVQKSYSANFPGEFGGGVINLTTKATPSEPFVSLSGSIGGDSYTTGHLGYVYYGSPTDWTGFDNGTRDIPGPLKAALNSGSVISEGAAFTRAELGQIASSLVNARTSVVQRQNQMPVNFSGNLTGGTSFDVGSVRLGVLATAGIGNTWRTRSTLQQVATGVGEDAALQRSFQRVVTDNRVVVNGLLGINAEFGEHVLRWTNLYIRDTIKQARLGEGSDLDQGSGSVGILKQDTAWYERQLIDTQLVGEFDFGDFDLDFRGSYANSQREAPYERGFTYVRPNGPNHVPAISPREQPDTTNPLANRYTNNLSGNAGDADIAFSDLNENLWSSGVDATYKLTPQISLGVGYAFTDTKRRSDRRSFVFRASGLNSAVSQLRPDYLLSDQIIQTNGIILQETSGQDGTAAFDAKLRTHAGYGQVIAQVTPALNATAGVRYESGRQRVDAVDIFNTGLPGLSGSLNTRIDKDYWLPSLTLTYELQPGMQVRASGSKTIARPQFRELISQVYVDTDTNRLFRGNNSLVDSQLWNAEARYEWFFARDQRFTAAAFYKKIDRPIETFSSIQTADVTTSFATAPEAQLYGAEVEVQKYFPLDGLTDNPLWASRRIVAIGNYTFTQSKLKVRDGDQTIINGVTRDASLFFRDGAPLTGQSDHLVNVQLGLEDTDHLSQQTFLLSYASKRVTSRGPSAQPDVYEYPGFRLDFVAREGITIAGVETEVKFEARNITATQYREFQQFDFGRIYYNRYDVGASVSLGLGLKF